MKFLDTEGVRQLKELNDAAYVGKEEYNDDTMVISAALNDLNSRIEDKQDALTFDSTPTSGSTNPVTSGGVYTALSTAGDSNVIETVKVNGTALTVTDKAVDVTVPTTLASLTDDSTHRLVTDTERTKLQGIATGAEVNVQSDWSVTDSTSDAYIVNKPTIPTKVSDLTNDSGYITGYTETDPVFTASAAHGITSSDISNWNGKQDALVSGTNIKTVNNESLLGGGNLEIQSGGGTEHNLRVPASAVFMPSNYTGGGGDSKNVNPQLYSSRKFSWSDLHNVGIIHRGVYNKILQNVSFNAPQALFGIYQSENTYLRIYFYSGIQIKCSLVVNGTTTQDVQLMANYRAALTGYCDYAIVFDRDKGVIRIYGYSTSTSTITKVAEYDVSQWDLSSFTNVYIAAHVQNMSNCMCCVTVLVNSPLTLGDYIAAPLYVGEWNTPIGTQYYEDITLAGTGIEVGGTVAQTISATDKVVSVSNASLDYFKLGPSNLGDDWQYFWYHVKMRFSSVGDGMYITGGRFWQKVIIEDADGLPVATLQAGDDKWYPAINTDYHLYYQFIHTSNDAVFGQTYQRNTGLRLYGTATFEVSEPYVYNPQVQNLCAETYNGAGFDGAIPFDGVCQFLDYEVTGSYTPSSQRIPLGALFFDKINHTIYMWEGSTWKRINNA